MGVGHTHEDVDAALALVTTALNAEDDIQTPADVCRILHSKLSPIFNRNNMDFSIEMVDTVNWFPISAMQFYSILASLFRHGVWFSIIHQKSMCYQSIKDLYKHFNYDFLLSTGERLDRDPTLKS